MAELLKNIYDRKFIKDFSSVVKQVYTPFNKSSFAKHIFNRDWEYMELKGRMRHISIVLNNHLTDSFSFNVKIILSIIKALESSSFKHMGFEFMFFPDFIELHGLDNYSVSIPAIENITQYVSCEFAVRPFLMKYPKKMLSQLLRWSNHPNAQVRRLASEGCRPRLPWAMALPSYKNVPTPIIPILENLKNDESESVRRSVANNLNDISKDHPLVVITLANEWYGLSEEINGLVKHACRTLLKQGNPDIMKLFGFGSIKNIDINMFKILTPKVKIGGHLEFMFELENKNAKMAKVRVEYGLYFQKANATLSKKVFKISEKEYQGKSLTVINRRQHFKIISTRKYHAGLHQLSIIINGNEIDKRDFYLIE